MLAWYGQQCCVTAQIHGYQCLRCTFSPIKKVSAKNSCCTAVRDAKKFGLHRCKVGELSNHTWSCGYPSAWWGTCLNAYVVLSM